MILSCVSHQHLFGGFARNKSLANNCICLISHLLKDWFKWIDKVDFLTSYAQCDGRHQKKKFFQILSHLKSQPLLNSNYRGRLLNWQIISS